MSDPTRWRHGEVPDEIRRMLESGRPTGAMPSEVRKRVSRKLGFALASSTGLYVLSWKSLALALTLGAAGLTTWIALPQRASTEKPASHGSTPGIVRGQQRAEVRAVKGIIPLDAPTLSHRASDVPVLPSLLPPLQAATDSGLRERSREDTTPEGSTPREHASTRKSRAPGAARAQGGTDVASARPASEDTLAAEVALLARARAQLEHHPEAALRTLEEHAQTFSTGQLGIERELLGIDVLDHMGNRSAARERAERLLEQAGGTIYEQRIRARIEQR